MRTRLRRGFKADENHKKFKSTKSVNDELKFASCRREFKNLVRSKMRDNLYCLTFLESKILIDFKLMLPSQGEEEDDCCLLLFFHKQNNTWEYEDQRESEPVQRNTTPNDAEEESSLQEDEMEARPGPLDSTNCPIAENSLKDTEPGGPQNGKMWKKLKKMLRMSLKNSWKITIH